jgi:endonuclease-8
MEGPSIVILREELQPFAGQRVLKVSGNTKQPKDSLRGCKLERIDTWGKVLFLIFTHPKRPPVITKTHFLMFGSYRINDPKPQRDPRLRLDFKDGTLYFYSCSIQFDAEKYWKAVDRRADLLSPKWDVKHVVRFMKGKKSVALCDLFLDQHIFAGSGNIVKNEVLFNIRRHPLTPLSRVPQADWPALARAVRSYCSDFYKWKKKFELRRHWQVYRKGICPLCNGKLTREKTGKLKRGSFYCPNCQGLPARPCKLKVFPVRKIAPVTEKEARLDH